jgi:phosphopantothenoylcysteine decarboxylase
MPASTHLPPSGPSPANRPQPEQQPPSRLLLGVSGSIAALSLPGHLHAYRAAGVGQIAVVMTRTAERFLPADTLRLITDAVYTEAEHGRGHVALARWADAVLVLPATAHVIGCLAHGLAPNLLTTTLLAVPGRAVVVPAMNPVMWSQRPVQRNVAQLRADGHLVLAPQRGLAYEVASRSVTDALVMPEPAEVLAALATSSQLSVPA